MEEKKVEIPYKELVWIYRRNRIWAMVHEKRRDNISSKRPASRYGLAVEFLRIYSGVEKWSDHLYEDEAVVEARERLKRVSKNTLDNLRRENKLQKFVEGMIANIENKIR
jgi:hypothetical protein